MANLTSFNENEDCISGSKGNEAKHLGGFDASHWQSSLAWAVITNQFWHWNSP
jgi:hypothetical protein